MSLLLNRNEDNDNVLDRRYNVECELGDGRKITFSNTLTNIDGEYFWFSSKKNGMDVIRQNTVRTMICIDKDKNN